MSTHESMSEIEYSVLTLPPMRFRKSGRVYYYQGNFFYPLNLVDNQQGLVLRAIREFTKKHKSMIDSDRKHPNYKTLTELANLE